jgi:membrane-bound serine protease (ClpP class)
MLVLGYALRASRLPPSSGTARLVGAEARVLDWSGRRGHVWADGERWQARAEADLAAGAPVRIRGIDGITLVVAPASGDRPEREA